MPLKAIIQSSPTEISLALVEMLSNSQKRHLWGRDGLCPMGLAWDSQRGRPVYDRVGQH